MILFAVAFHFFRHAWYVLTWGTEKQAILSLSTGNENVIAPDTFEVDTRDTYANLILKNRRLAGNQGRRQKMTNHPNRNRTFFTVRYGHHVAKFSSNKDAMYFCEAKSVECGLLLCVEHKTGLVGQYSNGKTLPEFQLHHDCRDNG